MTAVAPSPPVLDIEGLSWRSADALDAPEFDRIAGIGNARLLFGLPASEAEFAVRIDKPGFRIAMLCRSQKRAIGAAAITRRDNRNRHVQLLCMFARPESSSLALAMYVRHLFWSHPLNRVYAQIPVLEGTAAYGSMLAGAGFQQEGVVKGHSIIGERVSDVAVFGLLRAEFETWCQEREPRLLL